MHTVHISDSTLVLLHVFSSYSYFIVCFYHIYVYDKSIKHTMCLSFICRDSNAQLIFFFPRTIQRRRDISKEHKLAAQLTNTKNTN